MASTKIKLDANPEHKGPAGGKHQNETSVEATLYNLDSREHLTSIE